MVVVGEGSVAVVVGVSASLLVLALIFFLIQLPGRGGPFDLDDVGSVFCFSNIFILSLMLLIMVHTRVSGAGGVVVEHADLLNLNQTKTSLNEIFKWLIFFLGPTPCKTSLFDQSFVN